MLDVHPPHGKMEGVRDFFLHLFTITIGLLIALGLEAMVESHHHHTLRDEAEANLRQEIADNRKDIGMSHAAIAAEQAHLVQTMRFLEARQANRPADIDKFQVNFVLISLADANWRSASATGVLSYMDYDHVQRYAAAYHMQDQFAEIQQETINSLLQLHSYTVANTDPTTMTPAEATEALLDVRHAYAHLDAMDEIGQALESFYEKALDTK